MKHLVRASSLAACALSITSCTASIDPLTDAPPVLANYAAIMHATYDDAVTSATALRTASAPLYSGTPTAADLTAAQAAWRTSRVPYMQSEVARFYEGPIDEPVNHLSDFLNEWPLDEAAIDYVRADAMGTPTFGGIINMPTDFPTIDGTLIAERNFVGGEHNVTVGYHAIEFLLWGQDFYADSAGQRPFTDYVVGMQMNADRRRAYLDASTRVLVDDLTIVRDAWAPGTAGNYRSTFVALEPHEGVRRMMIGMIRLLSGEVGTDRIVPAYTMKLQEEEHSCFSDNTNDDLANDILGAANVYYGRYQRLDGTMVSGPGLSDLVRARDPMLDARVRAAFDQVLADARGWPTTASCPSTALQGRCPFDQLITGVDTDPGRMAIWNVHNELGALATTLRTDVTATLDVTITDGDLTAGE
jgi:putative iron-regulated protein